jgi:hypothetical protein
MAAPMIKSTYVLDLESAEALEQLATSWQVSKSEALRRVLKEAVAAPAVDRMAAFRRLQQAAGLSKSAATRWSAEVGAERRAAGPRTRARRT